MTHSPVEIHELTERMNGDSERESAMLYSIPKTLEKKVQLYTMDSQSRKCFSSFPFLN